MVGSEAFYNHNQFYFVIGIVTMMFEAVSFNTLSSVPALFMIIGLLSMYEIRKSFSRAYITAAFFTLYWVQIVMLIKLAEDLMMRVESVNYRLNNPADDIERDANNVYQILFGKLHSLDSIRKGEINLTSQYWISCVFICIYCAQGWKTCKWLEVRDKTTHLHNLRYSTIRFWKYIEVRELENEDELKLVNIHKSKDSKKVKKLMENNVK